MLCVKRSSIIELPRFFFVLDVRLAKFAKERSELQDQISHLRLELEEERNKKRKTSVNSSGLVTNGPNLDSDYDVADFQSKSYFDSCIYTSFKSLNYLQERLANN